MTSQGSNSTLGISSATAIGRRALPPPATTEASWRHLGNAESCQHVFASGFRSCRGCRLAWPGRGCTRAILTALASLGSEVPWEHIAAGRSCSFRHPDRRDPSHVYPATSGTRRLLAASGCMAWAGTRTTPDQIVRGQGLFALVWQVLGSNQRRLSRRFYSPLLLLEAQAADQHICRSRHDRGPQPSAMRPWASGLVHGRGRKNPRTGAVGMVTLTVRAALCL